jgi:hypothetical protein
MAGPPAPETILLKIQGALYRAPDVTCVYHNYHTKKIKIILYHSILQTFAVEILVAI